MVALPLGLVSARYLDVKWKGTCSNGATSSADRNKLNGASKLDRGPGSVRWTSRERREQLVVSADRYGGRGAGLDGEARTQPQMLVGARPS